MSNTPFPPTLHLKMKFTFIFVIEKFQFHLGYVAIFVISCFPMSDCWKDVFSEEKQALYVPTALKDMISNRSYLVTHMLFSHILA